jgi:hypothetical protein
MVKITLAVAAAAAMLTTAPLVTPAKEGIKLAQGVDVQIGRDRDYDWAAGTIGTVAGGTTPTPQLGSRWCHRRPTTALPHGNYPG